MIDLKPVMAAALFCLSGAAQAATLTDTLDEFSFDGQPPFPTAVQTVGTFRFDPMGERIVSASISGSFGNSLSASTAPFQLFADGDFIGECLTSDPCFVAPADAFQFTLSNLSILLDGEVVLSLFQTAQSVVRLGQTTLSVETAPSPVPLPAAGWMLVAGLAGFGAVRKRAKA